MQTGEYVRVCKRDGCNEEFVVATASMQGDRHLGLSEPEYCKKHSQLLVRSYSRVACHHFDMKLTPYGDQLIAAAEAEEDIGAENVMNREGRDRDPWALYGPGGIGRYQRKLRGFRANAECEADKSPKDFEISHKSEEFLDALERHQVVVLVGKTGSGKSTYIPWLLLTGGKQGHLSKWADRGPIVVTQPRIYATRSIPEFIANRLNGSALGPGSLVGYAHSGTDAFDRRVRLLFQTDGKLVNDIVSGRIANYSVVMIDEAHERSANIDLILALLRKQLYLYPHLRLVIASATINEQAFIEFYGGSERVGYVFSEGRQFPVHWHFFGETIDEWERSQSKEERWQGPASGVPGLVEWWRHVHGGNTPRRDHVPSAITELVRHLCRWIEELPRAVRQKEDGHILVFLPGTREIDQTVGLINAAGVKNTIALPLYAQRPLDEQDKALKGEDPDVAGKRRVVVSTNVAETSLTVEGVKFVIDSGFIKESFWNHLHCIKELRTVRHSKAGCRQRWGRAGRTAAGHAFMLFTKEEFEDFPDETSPELARASLENVLLTAKLAGVRSSSHHVVDLEWMPLPHDQQESFRSELGRAYASLVRKQAIDAEGDLTLFGLELGGIPAPLEVARICAQAEHLGMGVEGATLLPFLALEQGLQALLIWDSDGTWDTRRKLQVRRAHQDLVFGCEDDLDLYLKLWTLWEAQPMETRERWAEGIGLDFRVFEKKIADERMRLLDSAKDWRKAQSRSVRFESIDALRALIASCLPQEIYGPIEGTQGDSSEPTLPNRFAETGLTEWLGLGLSGSVLEEDDDVVSYDESCVERCAGRSGVYRRLGRAPDDVGEGDLIEIAPSSVCFDRKDAVTLVACRRGPNWRRPARTRILVTNIVRVQTSWLPDLIQDESLVRKLRLYRILKRQGVDARRATRLLLPFLLPRGTRVTANLSHDAVCGTTAEVNAPVPAALTKSLGSGSICVRAVFPKSEIPLDVKAAEVLEAEVDAYDLDENQHPSLRLRMVGHPDRSFSAFAKQFRVGQDITVRMLSMLEDPLGRNPLFLVREERTGLEVPMADTDFSGGTRPHAYYGTRFPPGELLKVEVAELDKANRLVRLSRRKALFQEYLGISDVEHMQLVEARVERTDSVGVYLAVPGVPSFISFVRWALWLGDAPAEPGRAIEARVRRVERQLDPDQIKRLLSTDKTPPRELDLSIESDVRSPAAFNKFVEHEGRGDGDIITVEIIREVEGGGVLVKLAEDLLAIVWKEELGVDDNGQLLRAKDFKPGSSRRVRIFQVHNSRKRIHCSFFRLAPPPTELKPGLRIDVDVLAVSRDNRDTNIFYVTACYDKRYCVRLSGLQNQNTEPRRGEGLSVRVGGTKDFAIQGIWNTAAGGPSNEGS